ncbi:MAG: hypothetical protein JKY98_00270 [Gammaproteobacteria bacterium]|nr:hypothetical protein [Gammaproteobacteria bacterium]
MAQGVGGPTNMGPVVNSAARDAEPTFTSDDNTMYFNCFDRQGQTGGFGSKDLCYVPYSAVENIR